MIRVPRKNPSIIITIHNLVVMVRVVHCFHSSSSPAAAFSSFTFPIRHALFFFSFLGFDRIESSSPTSDWKKPVLSNNSSANGWSNFQPQQQTTSNPSRSNSNSNQWLDMNNFYGATTPTNTSNTGSFNMSQHNNDNK